MKIIIGILAFTLAFTNVVCGEKIGKRPYEMDWAQRFEDPYPVIEDFEEADTWLVETRDAIASFERSREQQMFGKYVYKLTYRSNGGRPAIAMRLKTPKPVLSSFDMVGCWIYGNNWAWMVDANTPQVTVSLLFTLGDNSEIPVTLTRINWREWFLPLKRLDKEQSELLNGKGVHFAGFRIEGAFNKADRVLFFDSVSLQKEAFQPLSFKPRPMRGIDMFPGQGTGANTGPGRLPFPTREETILPDSCAKGANVSLSRLGNTFRMVYDGIDGQLEYTYAPVTGRWDDITAKWNKGQVEFKPLLGGGAMFSGNNGGNPRGIVPEKAEHLGTDLAGDAIVSRWRYALGNAKMDVTYTMRLKGKTLMLDTQSMGGILGAVSYGCARGLAKPRSVKIPYYSYGDNRPGIVVSGDENAPLFFSAHTCWYRSNASAPWGESRIAQNGDAYANGGTIYTPKTDGARNDCFERFFITVGPKFEEHLPNIPNPKSPWKHITGSHVWRAHGAGNRDNDKSYWRNIWRHGMRKILVTDHETCWRDGAESFTFRTKAAPGKGGDQGMKDYAHFMQKELGFVYGPYNNFTDFAPVNEYWSTDMVGRMPNNQLQPAWARCYGPKPQFAVEFCALLSPINQAKYNFSTAYCDVHTSVTPWSRCDYDFRVPGAGTFAATFYAYGEIMLLQKAAWNGPVYSEGPHFCFYSGLTDGNYAQDRSYNIAQQPWLVDFDLLKIHEQECNFGMGNHSMFDVNEKQGKQGIDETNASVDRFLAATAAFGHPGFLVAVGGIRNTMRGYFLLQQLHSRYTMSSVDSIRYVDAAGRQLTTSQAVANGAFKRSQLAVRYKDGTNVVVNGNMSETMSATVGKRKILLPPNGYSCWTEDGLIEVFSGLKDGVRTDYASTPEYIYIDGRDKAFQRFDKAAGMGAGVCRKNDDSTYEIIMLDDAECGFDIPAVSARALGKDMTDLGEAKLRRARGLVYVVPVKGAFSYIVKTGKVEAAPCLTCEQDVLCAGETVTVKTHDGRSFEVSAPLDANVGERLWFEKDGLWIDFTVQDMFAVKPEIDGGNMVFSLTSLRKQTGNFICELDGVRKTLILGNSFETQVSFPLPENPDSLIEKCKLQITFGKMHQAYECFVISRTGKIVLLEGLEKDYTAAVGLRGKPESDSLAEHRAVAINNDMSCNGITKSGIFMHPPYVGGTGYVCTKHNIKVPDKMPCVFSAQVGKRDGGFPGDGILFKVIVVHEGKDTVIGEQSVTNFEWKPLRGDLTPWAGKNIQLKLVSDVGPNDNSEADWACWGELRIESREEVLLRDIDFSIDAYATEVPKDFVKGLTAQRLRTATGGWLCYESQGVNSSPGNWESYGVLNGVPLGLLPSGVGDSESRNIWSRETRIPLSADAIRKLMLGNRFVWINTARDCFKVRRFRIVLDFADGSQVSSLVSTAVFTQPSTWSYGEGILVDAKDVLTVPVMFK